MEHKPISPKKSLLKSVEPAKEAYRKRSVSFKKNEVVIEPENEKQENLENQEIQDNIIDNSEDEDKEVGQNDEDEDQEECEIIKFPKRPPTPPGVSHTLKK